MFQTKDAQLWKRHIGHMHQALDLARDAALKGEIPVGALVVQNGRIIGRGQNLTEQLKDPTAHAEMIAISAACDTVDSKYLSKATLYVTLEPCVMCTGGMIWSKLERVVFGAADPKGGGCGSLFNLAQNKKLNHRVDVIQGVLEEECSDLLKRFFKERR